MKITIDYKSSWRNSFLDGDNNEALPKTGRKYIASMTSLRKPENYIERDVSIDTVMGLLNRLIGDQRKLYQARASEKYYFSELDPKDPKQPQPDEITYKDIENPRYTNNELIYLRNVGKSTDQNSYTGMIMINDPVFNSDYSAEFWSILGCGIDELVEFVINRTLAVNDIKLDPLSIISRLEEIQKLKPIENIDNLTVACDILANKFEEFKGINKNGLVDVIKFYCCALYLQFITLSDKYDMASAKAPRGGIKGISHNSFTKKNFMSSYTTGKEKKIWGNPYVCDANGAKGEGKIKKTLKKAGGKLEIDIPVDRQKAAEIKTMIENAGVSSFYLGKKGLAYVSSIRG